jgi:hypothetical protein
LSQSTTSRPRRCQVCNRLLRAGERSFCPDCRAVVERLPDTQDAWTRDLPADLRAERAARVQRHQARVLIECARRGLAAGDHAQRGGAA